MNTITVTLTRPNDGTCQVGGTVHRLGEDKLRCWDVPFQTGGFISVVRLCDDPLEELVEVIGKYGLQSGG